MAFLFRKIFTYKTTLNQSVRRYFICFFSSCLKGKKYPPLKESCEFQFDAFLLSPNVQIYTIVTYSVTKLFNIQNESNSSFLLHIGLADYFRFRCNLFCCSYFTFTVIRTVFFFPFIKVMVAVT